MEKSEMERIIPMLVSTDAEMVALGLVTCGEIIHDMNDFMMIRYNKEFPNMSPETQEKIKKIFQKNAKKNY